ncbi:MAG: phage holin family protein [Pseudomonadota bacterium]
MADIRDTPSEAVTAVGHFTQLMETELKIAKAEMSRNLARAVVGIAFICVAALTALVALNTLAGALVGILTAQGIPFGLSALAIAAVLLVCAVVFALAGKSRLSPEALSPSATASNINQDLVAVKDARHV